MVQVGGFELYSVITGRFGLDGGAMFGVVPKVLWERATRPDDQNRIPLVTRTLIAIHPIEHRVILVDTGCGTKWTPEQADRFAISHDSSAIDRALESLGFTRFDVTDVVVTHLHFDHNGGLSDCASAPGGATFLRYPSARHWIHRRHWEHAHRPHSKDRASFLPQDSEALDREGVLSFVDSDRPDSPMPGWEWVVSHGHTPFQLHPVFKGGDVSLVWAGDLIPTRHHIRPTWVMAYDVEPMKTIDEKTVLYRRFASARNVFAFAHDPDWGAARVTGSPSKPESTPFHSLTLSV